MNELYRAKVFPLREGKQGDIFEWGYTHAASVAQAHSFLMRRYPYPKYFVEAPVEDSGTVYKPGGVGSEFSGGEPIELTGGEPPNRCAKLLPFREIIKNELADEQEAADKYHEWAEKFDELKDSRKADVIRLIGGQEMLHWLILDSIVQDITEECGK